ncbi:hypothetical protein J2S70_000475 [Trueperella bonasi]|uniref:Uncharacterized protein n=1 Tax=Trueperella bonasi TaxID=312286 RepID=A0ABT9NGE1_9ACTO|nr:hypothetical protein [Trueperella bonasi]
MRHAGVIRDTPSGQIVTPLRGEGNSSNVNEGSSLKFQGYIGTYDTTLKSDNGNRDVKSDRFDRNLNSLTFED